MSRPDISRQLGGGDIAKARTMSLGVTALSAILILGLVAFSYRLPTNICEDPANFDDDQRTRPGWYMDLCDARN
jgi:hypothetical protein